MAVPGGLTSLAWMRAQLVERPSLHPLLLVLKLYLKQNGWDDPAFGGLGSYLLFVIVRDGGLAQHLARSWRLAAGGAAPLATPGRREQVLAALPLTLHPHPTTPTPYTLHPIPHPYTPHPTPYTLHPTPTPHTPTPYTHTSHPTPHTHTHTYTPHPHPTPYTYNLTLTLMETSTR